LRLANCWRSQIERQQYFCEKMELIAPSLMLLAAAVARDPTGANILDQIRTGNLSYASMAVLVVLGIMTLYVAYRIGRFLLKVFCILVGLAAIVAAVSWFLLQH
jgi:hypothetical protein